MLDVRSWPLAVTSSRHQRRARATKARDTRERVGRVEHSQLSSDLDGDKIGFIASSLPTSSRMSFYTAINTYRRPSYPEHLGLQS